MEQKPPKDDYRLKPSDVAKRHNLGRQTVLNWIREGRLPAVDFGDKKPSYRISESAYQTFLATRAIGHPPRARPLSNRAMLLLHLRDGWRAQDFDEILAGLRARKADPNERSLQEELRRMGAEDLVAFGDENYDLTPKGAGYADTLKDFLEAFTNGDT